MRRVIATLIGLTLLVAACGDGDDQSDASAAETPAKTDAADTGEGNFPVTIEHALGTTEIEEQPERVVTLGYGEGDIVAGLGLTPLAVNSYGSSDGVSSPWLDDAVDGAELELLDTADGIPYEQIAALQPDVVLALLSDIDASAYDLLSEIAPTVAYQTGPFRDSWQDASLTAGRALGLEEEAQALIDGVEETIDETAAANPELEGKTASVVLAISSDQAGVLNSPEENTIRTLLQLGMELPPAVAELEVGPTGYSAVLSLEQIGVLDADLLLLYAITEEARAALTSNALFEQLDVTTRDDVLAIEPATWQALRTPSVLSIPYALERLVDPMVEAIEN